MCTSKGWIFHDISAKVSVLVEFVSHLVAFGCILYVEHREDLGSDILIQPCAVLLLHLDLNIMAHIIQVYSRYANGRQCRALHKNARMRRFCIGKMHEARSVRQGRPQVLVFHGIPPLEGKFFRISQHQNTCTFG